MKLMLASRVRAPYGGIYRWTDPMTGVEVSGTTFDMLMERAQAQRRANTVPIGLGFEDEVMTQVCKDYPKECEFVDAAKPRLYTWSMGDIVRGTQVMLNFQMRGQPTVSQEEANRRAEICMSCPWRVQFSKPCTGLCRELVELLSSTGSKSTPFDSDLRGCGVCGCWSKVAVWFPLEVQCVGVTTAMKEQFAAIKQSHPCWKQCE